MADDSHIKLGPPTRFHEWKPAKNFTSVRYKKPKNGAKEKSQPEWLLEARRLQSRGHDFASIALAVGVSEQTVKAWMDENTILRQDWRKRTRTKEQKEAVKAKDRERKKLAKKRYYENLEKEKANVHTKD